VKLRLRYLDVMQQLLYQALDLFEPEAI